MRDFIRQQILKDIFNASLLEVHSIFWFLEILHDIYSFLGSMIIINFLCFLEDINNDDTTGSAMTIDIVISSLFYHVFHKIWLLHCWIYSLFDFHSNHFHWSFDWEGIMMTSILSSIMLVITSSRVLLTPSIDRVFFNCENVQLNLNILTIK